MMNFIYFYFLFISFIGLNCLDVVSLFAKPNTQQLEYKCSPAKEYITVLSYLKQNKNLNIPETQQKIIAEEISQSCSGGAKRFINVVEVLTKSHLSVSESINLAKDYALSDDDKTEAFLMMFSLLYLSEYLDLDINSALKVAQNFSSNFSGDIKIAKVNFQKIVDFCVASKHLSLTHVVCAELASRITQCGYQFVQEIASSFKEAFYFLTSSKNDAPNLITSDAIGIAEELVCTSPYALDNFKTAFKFAISKSGHNLPRAEAIKFALNLAKKTNKQKLTETGNKTQSNASN